MFKRIRSWFEANREWNRRHREAWEGATKPAEDGLSAFQRLCETTLLDVISRAHGAVGERTVTPFDKDEVIVFFKVTPINLPVWIAADGAQAGEGRSELRLEEWDALSPEELTGKLCELVETRLRRAPLMKQL